MTEVLARHRGDHAHVDPYRLTSGLLARHKPTPGRELLAEVYL
jgi:sirohydrochlorin ferrochelatase